MRPVYHKGGLNTQETYKGIPVHAVAGVHEAVAETLCSELPSGARVADLGAGDGALSQRLKDIGFDVVAFDLDNTRWMADNVGCHPVDLERNVQVVRTFGPFDAICAIEIIEHLENPRGFLRELVALSHSHRTTLIITTPNPLDLFSSVTLFTRGVFNWFSRAHYTDGGHISILPYWLIDEHLKFLGVEDRRWRFLGPFRPPVFWKRWLYVVLLQLRKLTRKGRDRLCEGQTAMVVAHI